MTPEAAVCSNIHACAAYMYTGCPTHAPSCETTLATSLLVHASMHACGTATNVFLFERCKASDDTLVDSDRASSALSNFCCSTAVCKFCLPLCLCSIAAAVATMRPGCSLVELGQCVVGRGEPMIGVARLSGSAMDICMHVKACHSSSIPAVCCSQQLHGTIMFVHFGRCGSAPQVSLPKRPETSSCAARLVHLSRALMLAAGKAVSC
jgi:hypothetical protein